MSQFPLGALVQGPPRSQAGKRGGRTTQTKKAEELKEDRRPRSPTWVLPQAQAPRKRTGSSPSRAPDWSNGKRGRADLSVAGGTVRLCRFRPIKYCLLLLLVTGFSFWTVDNNFHQTMHFISRSRNTSTSHGFSVSISHGFWGWGQVHGCPLATDRGSVVVRFSRSLSEWQCHSWPVITRSQLPTILSCRGELQKPSPERTSLTAVVTTLVPLAITTQCPPTVQAYYDISVRL